MYTPTKNYGQFHANSDMTPNFYTCMRTRIWSWEFLLLPKKISDTSKKQIYVSLLRMSDQDWWVKCYHHQTHWEMLSWELPHWLGVESLKKYEMKFQHKVNKYLPSLKSLDSSFVEKCNNNFRKVISSISEISSGQKRQGEPSFDFAPVQNVFHSLGIDKDSILQQEDSGYNSFSTQAT